MGAKSRPAGKGAAPERRLAGLKHELHVQQAELRIQNEELRRVQVAIEKSRDRFVDLYDLAPVGYLTLDDRGVIKESNLTCASLLGVERDGLLGRPLSAYVRPEDGDRWHLFFKSLARSGERHSCALVLRRGDGLLFHGHLACQSQPGTESERGVRIALTDVGEEMRAADALRDSQERLGIVLNGSNEGYWDWSVESGRTVISGRLREIFGLVEVGPETVQQYDPAWMERIHPEDLVRGTDAVKALLEGRADRIDLDFRWNATADSWRWVRARGSVVRRSPTGHALRVAGTVTDVTEYKGLHESLRRGEAMYAAMARSFPGGTIGLFDRDLRYILVGGRGHGFENGHGPSLEGRAVLDTFPQEHRQQIAIAFRSALEGRASEHELSIQGRVLEVRVGPVADSEGCVVLGIATTQDITERRQAERERRFSSLLIDRMQEAVITVDPRGHVTSWTGGAAAIYGWTEDEALGKPVFSLVQPALTEAAVAEYAAGLASRGTDRAVVRQRRKDGDSITIDSTLAALTDPGGNVTGFLAVCRDVTREKAAEEARRESERRLRLLTDQLPVGIFQTGAQGDIVFANPAFRSMTGLSDPEVYGPVMKNVAHPEDEEWVTREWQDAVATGRPYAGEYRHLLADGKELWVRASGTPLLDRSGAVAGFVGALLDITEPRALQAQLSLASRLTAMGTLVTGVAHEINNPLSCAISGGTFALDVAQDLLKRLGGDASVDRETLLRIVDSMVEGLVDAQVGTSRVAQIVKDLTTFGRPVAGRKRIRLVDVVAAATRWLPTEVELEDRGAPDVTGSSGQLEQVVVNLLSNAAKATPEGAREKILIRIGPGEPGMARLEVIDQGTGIEPALMERIFDPFFTTRPVGEGRGTGLGLAICHAIVTAHGGTLTVKSAPDMGSTFRLELPAAPADA
jgi:PAS domain S-box-containing protein